MQLEQSVCILPSTLEAITISLNTWKHSNLLIMNQHLLQKLFIVLWKDWSNDDNLTHKYVEGAVGDQCHEKK